MAIYRVLSPLGMEMRLNRYAVLIVGVLSVSSAAAIIRQVSAQNPVSPDSIGVGLFDRALTDR